MHASPCRAPGMADQGRRAWKSELMLAFSVWMLRWHCPSVRLNAATRPTVSCRQRWTAAK